MAGVLDAESDELRRREAVYRGGRAALSLVGQGGDDRR